MGMTRGQIVLRVELPLALPLIFAGIRTATVFVVATATIAAVAGGGGLGDIIVNQAGFGSKASSAPRSASRYSRSPPTPLSASTTSADAAGTTNAGACVGADVVTGVTRL